MKPFPQTRESGTHAYQLSSDIVYSIVLARTRGCTVSTRHEGVGTNRTWSLCREASEMLTLGNSPLERSASK